MKIFSKILVLCLLMLVSVSCSDDAISYSCTQGTIRILNKQKSSCARGGGWCYFGFYLYDGNSSYWCTTNERTYELYNINDTLPTLVITKTIHEKQQEIK